MKTREQIIEETEERLKDISKRACPDCLGTGIEVLRYYRPGTKCRGCLGTGKLKDNPTAMLGMLGIKTSVGMTVDIVEEYGLEERTVRRMG
jgi:DnaJ-class molecular chaperone